MPFIIIFLFLISFNLSNAHEKCFTAQNNLSTEEKSKLSITQEIPNWLFERQNMQYIFDSPKGYFHIHYNTSGINAVPLDDEDNNGIPDYVDSVAYYFDMAYEEMVLNMGYSFRFWDGDFGGTPNYDIYLKELGRYNFYGGTMNNAVIFNDTDTNLQVSHIVIDNDFSENDLFITPNGDTINTYATHLYDGMKITAIHEFHHAIQIQMGSNRNLVIPEMTSTFMEFRFFPWIKDYLNYVDRLFERPSSFSMADERNPKNGYPYSIFFQYTYTKYGDDFLLDVWQLIDKGVIELKAIDSVLKIRKSSLQEAYCELMEWIYYSGENTQEENEFFTNSKDFPKLLYEREVNFSGLEVGFTAALTAFSFSTAKIEYQSKNRSKDTVLYLIPSIDENGIYMGNQSSNQFQFLTYSSDEFDEYYDELVSHSIELIYDNEKFCLKRYNNLGIVGRSISYCYPQPFNIRTNDVLRFDTPKNVYPNDIVTLKIYSVDMSLILSESLEVIPHRGQNVVSSATPKRLSPAVYIYSIEKGDESKVGKFIVVSR